MLSITEPNRPTVCRFTGRTAAARTRGFAAEEHLIDAALSDGRLRGSERS